MSCNGDSCDIAPRTIDSPVMRSDGVRYESLGDAAFDMWMHGDALNFKSGSNNIRRACDGFRGQAKAYGFGWRWCG